MKSGRFLQGFDTVDSFAADLKARMMLEEGANRGPYGDFVFDNEDAFGHGPRGTIAQRPMKESRVNPAYGVIGAGLQGSG